VRQVCGFARNVGGQPIEVEDAAVVALTLDRGMVATLHSGYYLDRGYHSSMTLWGSEGWVRFDLSSGKPLEWHSTHAGAPAGIQTFAYQRGDNPYLPLVQSAVDGARGVAPPVITGEESLSALELVFGIYRAAESGVAQRLS
jgi:predicted dehydrogenase